MTRTATIVTIITTIIIVIVVIITMIIMAVITEITIKIRFTTANFNCRHNSHNIIITIITIEMALHLLLVV